MNHKLKYVLFTLSAAILLGSCKDDDNVPNYGNGGAAGTSVSLQASSTVTIGMATNYDALGASGYLQTAAANASQTTFENAMTHGAIVQEDGSFNFAMPDAQYSAVTASGLKVWGHTLCWYQNQNGDYLNNSIGGAVVMPNLLSNADFEDWDGDQVVNWNYLNGNGTYGNFTQGTGANVQSGSSSLSMDILQTTALSSSWRLQLGSSEFPTVVGHDYKVTFWAKASSGECVAQYEWDHDGTPIYNYTSLSTDWAQYTCAFGDNGATPLRATKATTTIAFDMANNPVGANVLLDNVVITDLTAADSIANALASPEEKAARIESELHDWVTAMATHYRGQVTGWDVVTELFTDDGSIRTNANTSTEGHSDWFVWSEYLGQNTGVVAFKAARAADPNALLFINENNIEGQTSTSSAKLEALLNYVQYLKDQGAPIDGISAEMHVGINMSKTGVDYMFQKLAATGLKIRISQLDVSVNNVRGFALTSDVLSFQAVTYHDVVASYLQNVPEAQRQDITLWGVNDANSWLYNDGADFPLLFDENYVTKPAFDGFLNALKGGQ